MTDREIVEALEKISTATLTTLLLKQGLRSMWMRKTKPLSANQPRIVGPAFTLRFLPGREDLATPEALATSRSTRAAIEEMPAGCIIVADAHGVEDAGIFGDILCARARMRGVVGLVTDGAMRDAAGVRRAGLPVWCDDIVAPPSYAALTFLNWQEPIGCGGVAVFPGDMIVADDDGAVLIPMNIVEEIAHAGLEQEKFEDWVMDEVEAGTSLPGLYPPNEATLSRYQTKK